MKIRVEEAMATALGTTEMPSKHHLQNSEMLCIPNAHYSTSSPYKNLCWTLDEEQEDLGDYPRASSGRGNRNPQEGPL